MLVVQAVISVIGTVIGVVEVVARWLLLFSGGLRYVVLFCFPLRDVALFSGGLRLK